MAFETKYSMGLEDITFVQFECKKCHVRTGTPPTGEWQLPYECPSCHAPWFKHDAENINEATARTVVYSIAKAGDFLKERDFTLSFEVKGKPGA